MKLLFVALFLVAAWFVVAALPRTGDKKLEQALRHPEQNPVILHHLRADMQRLHASWQEAQQRLPTEVGVRLKAAAHTMRTELRDPALPQAAWEKSKALVGEKAKNVAAWVKGKTGP